ncbi:MAG TPA: BON domain-containing protein [Candidatus Acidoferrum sp.]|nr:BON domain-containing protein [Candidatus Acidoferrum sp.]
MRGRLVFSAVVLAMALAAGCARKPDDAALVTSIKAQMFSDAQLKGANLQVTSNGGQVTLSGAVPSDAARLDAYKIATQTPGVTKVSDQMTVQASVAEPQPAPSSPEVASKSTPPAAVKKPEKRHHKDRSKQLVASNADLRESLNPPVDQNPPATAPPPPVQEAPPTAPATPIATPAPPPPPPREVQIPSGETVSIRMIDGVDSAVNQTGEIFHAALEAPIVVGDEVVVPKGADVYVRLASASSAGRMSGQSDLRLELVKLEFQGQSYPLVSSTYSLTGSSRGKDTAKKVGAGAVLGTLLGAIAGGGKGAAIGAAAGAGAGGVYQASTHGKQVKIPSETKLDFQLEQPVTVTVMPHSAPADQ